jgi:hypothetical protein
VCGEPCTQLHVSCTVWCVDVHWCGYFWNQVEPRVAAGWEAAAEESGQELAELRTQLSEQESMAESERAKLVGRLRRQLLLSHRLTVREFITRVFGDSHRAVHGVLTVWFAWLFRHYTCQDGVQSAAATQAVLEVRWPHVIYGTSVVTVLVHTP